MPLLVILAMFFVSVTQGECETYDNDTTLEFYWTAATGNVHHYNVYLSVDSGEYSFVGTTPAVPSAETPYNLPVTAEDGKQYQIKIEAEDASGGTGPMSEPSGPVYCELLQSITLTSANGGEIWRSGSNHVINWVTTGADIDHIHILYSTDGGMIYQDIVANTVNSGSYEWTIPSIDSSTVRVKVIAEDTSNNLLAEDQSDADFTIDSTAPETSTTLTGAQGENGWYTTDVTVELSATDNLSGVMETKYKIDEGVEQVYSASFTTSGGTIYCHSQDNAGNAEADKSTQVKVDKTVPDTPVVTDDGDCTADVSQLHASWISSDTESGLVEYQYAVGATSGGTDVVNWTSVGVGTEVNATGLGLTTGQTYYFAVKARNEAGLWSSIGNSDGITYQLPQIGVLPNNLTFSAVAGGANPDIQKLSITNPGCGTLTWTMSDNADWLSLSPASGDCTDETDEVSVSVDIAGLSGTYDAAITVSAAGASNTSQTVLVTLNVAELISVTLSEPNGEEQMKGNSIHNVIWNTTGTGIDHIHLLYSTDSGVIYQDIVANAMNNGTYEWTTPAVDSSTVLMKVIAEDTSNNLLAEDQSDADFSIDSTAPATPSAFVASAGNEQVTLSWDDNSEPDLAGYEVYRSMTSDQNYTPIASVTMSSYTDTGLSNGNTYYYVVAAIDLSGNYSGFSNEVNATPAEVLSGSATLIVSSLISDTGILLEETDKLLVQNSDDKWWQISSGCYTSFQFSDAIIPTGAGIISVVICVEHWENKGFKGNIEWNLGTGWPSSVDEWGSMIYMPIAKEQTEVWDVTDMANTPEKLNAMELCIRNGSTNGKTVNIDHIYAQVEWGKPDTEKPEAVNDLATDETAATANSLVLTWTASGDDSMTGSASQYDIRYSSQGEIDTEEKWNDATQCPNESSPSTAGTTEHFTVAGLSVNTTYWFALKIADEVPNWSALSNSHSGTTREAVAQTMWVSAINMSLKKNDTSVRAIADVTVTGALGVSVSEATVYGHWNDEVSKTRSGVTGSDGKVAFNSDRIKNPAPDTTFTFTVDDVVKDGWTYCSSANVETCDSIGIPLSAPAFVEAYPTGLLDAFPNPANPETWIPYTLSESEHVTIKIYTISGMLVRTLELGQQGPDAYVSKEKAAYWDGRNEAGEEVVSGIYFYCFEAGSFYQIRNMIILK